jgi:hypothetical protein
VHARLCAEAEHRGVTLDQLISGFADSLPGVDKVETQKRLSFIGIGDSGRGDLGRRHREIRKQQTNGSDPGGPAMHGSDF